MDVVQRAPQFRLIAFLAVLFLATLGGLIVGDGNPVLALGPILGVGAFYAMLKLRLRVSVLAMLFCVLIADYIAERPADGYWQSPFYAVGRMLYVNLNHLTPLPFLRFPPLDFLILFLGGIAVYRKANKLRIDPPGGPSARILNQALILSFATLMVWEVWGIARGGALKQSLWQFHQLGFIPLLTFLLLAALRGAEDQRVLARMLVFGACVKSLVGIYFIYFIAEPQGIVPEFATSHSDTFLYVTALVMALVIYIEAPTRKNFWQGALYVPLITWGMVVNDRRLAYVSLGASVLTVFLMSPWTALKRKFVRSIILGIPVIALYIVTGWTSNGRIFIPVQTFKSVLFGEEHVRGPDYRDMENFNLLMTWNRNPILGSGFGHKFEEPVKLPDISVAMPDYQYQPHNTILWLWGVLGPMGYSCLFMYLVVAVYLAARSYRMAAAPSDRSAALMAIAVIIQYFVQCFGDMGTISWLGVFFVSFALAEVGKLSIRVGAWPAPVKRPLAQPEALPASMSAVPLTSPLSLEEPR